MCTLFMVHVHIVHRDVTNGTVHVHIVHADMTNGGSSHAHCSWGCD